MYKTMTSSQTILCLTIFLPFLSLNQNVNLNAQSSTLFSDNYENQWLNTFTQTGVTTIRPHSIAVANDGTIYLGGVQSQGNAVPPGPAVWMFRDNTWTALDRRTDWSTTDVGFNGTVFSVALGPDGTLYAGGAFTEIDGTPMNGIAMFDGENWQPMGNGLTDGTNQEVRSIQVSDDGVVFAGGNFGSHDNTSGTSDKAGIAAWNGEEWVSLAGGVLNSRPTSNTNSPGRVYAMTLDADGRLWVTGRFATAGGTYTQNIAILSAETDGDGAVTGYRWSRPALFISEDDFFERDPREIHSVAVTSDFDVYITGNYIPFATDPWEYSFFLMYDGQTWSVPDEGLRAGANAGQVTVGSDGTIYHSNTNPDHPSNAYMVNMYRDGAWARIGNGSGESYDRRPDVLATDMNDHLIIAGEFRTVAPTESDDGRMAVEHVARWDGERWNSIGNTITAVLFGNHPLTNQAIIYDITQSADGHIAFAGWFGQAAGLPVNGAAIWDVEDGNWSYLTEDIDILVSGNRLRSQSATYDHDGTLIIGGNFQGRTNRSGEVMQNVAYWDGDDWQNMGDGLTGSSLHVHSLLTASDGTVYAAGFFQRSGDTDLRNIARWDGEKWDSLGGGLSAVANILIEDPNGDIIAGGDFQFTDGRFSGNPVNKVARWDGESWHAFGEGLPPMTGQVRALVYDPDGLLYAGTHSGELFMWDGNEWILLDDGLNRVSGNGIESLVIDRHGTLYAGGGFNSYNDDEISRFVWWDGESWNNIGPESWGIGNYIKKLHIHDDIMYMAGSFRNASGRISNGLATWQIPENGPVSIDRDPDSVLPDEFLIGSNYPNPFNPSTTIRFSIPEASAVTLEVFDLLGRRISLLADREFPAGTHQAVWDASGFASGVYLYRITSASHTFTGKMMLLK